MLRDATIIMKYIYEKLNKMRVVKQVTEADGNHYNNLKHVFARLCTI